MKDIERSPDAEQRRRIMDFIMAAGQTLLESGAEVFRVEQTMQIMARSYHLREFQVYVLTNGIFASAGKAEVCEVRYVPSYTVHLGRIEAVNALSRRIAAEDLPLEQAERGLAQARALPSPGLKTRLWSGAVGSFGFAMMFGGTLRAGLVAAVAGLLAMLYLDVSSRYRFSGGFQKITAALLITLVCLLGCRLVNASVSQAVIGALMLLTPGIAFTMSIRDFVHGDYLSGTIRMIDALLVAASIAIGAGIVLRAYTLLTGVNAV